MDGDVPDGSQSEPCNQKGKVTTNKRKPTWVWASENTKIIIKIDELGKTIVVGVCKWCSIEINAHSIKGGNNDITNHVKKCKLNPARIGNVGASQTVLTQSSMGNSLTPHTFSQKRLEEKVVEFFVRDEHPFRAVEGNLFMAMMKEAQRQFKIPDRKRLLILFGSCILLR